MFAAGGDVCIEAILLLSPGGGFWPTTERPRSQQSAQSTPSGSAQPCVQRYQLQRDPDSKRDIHELERPPTSEEGPRDVSVTRLDASLVLRKIRADDFDLNDAGSALCADGTPGVASVPKRVH